MDTPWVQQYTAIGADDFVYFSYEVDPASQYCNGDPHSPDYTQLDTCRSIDDWFRRDFSANPDSILGSASLLNSLINQLVIDQPDVKIDILAHSQGGVLAAYWLAQVAAPVVADNLSSVVTFDSPLGGINVFQRLWALQRCAVEQNPLLPPPFPTSPYDSPYDMAIGSPVIGELQDAPGRAGFFTMRTSAWDITVEDDRGTFENANCDSPADFTPSPCPGVVDFYAYLGDHTDLWEQPIDQAKMLVGCAVSGQVWRCLPTEDQYLALEQGQNVQTTAVLGTGQQSATFCVCDVGSQADLTLLDPNGATVSTGTPGVEHLKGPGYDVWRVPDPLGGAWTLDVYGADIPPGGEIVLVQIGTEGAASSDGDSDGVGDTSDNCVAMSNWSQADNDGDGAGDACDSDDDDDTVLDVSDNCRSSPNAGQVDSDDDGWGDACDGDSDNDGMMDIDEASHSCLVIGENDGVLDFDSDSLANLAELLVLSDPCIGDTDEDGFKDGAEAASIGTSPTNACGPTGWPLDIVSSGFSANKVDVVDLASYVVPARRLGTNSDAPGFDRRWDIVPGATFGTDINVQDMAAFISGSTGFPPMLGGARAFNARCPVP